MFMTTFMFPPAAQAQVWLAPPSNLQLTPSIEGPGLSLVLTWDGAVLGPDSDGHDHYTVHLREVPQPFGGGTSGSWPEGVGVTDVASNFLSDAFGQNRIDALIFVPGEGFVDTPRTIRFTNLKPATTYEARVREANSNRQLSDWSDTVQAFFGTEQLDDADLESLLVTDSAGAVLQLSPAFAPKTETYTAHVAHSETTGITVNTVTKLADSTVAVVQPESYAVGMNTVTAQVTAANGLAREYHINMIRLPNVSVQSPLIPVRPLFTPVTAEYRVDMSFNQLHLYLFVTYGPGVGATWESVLLNEEGQQTPARASGGLASGGLNAISLCLTDACIKTKQTDVFLRFTENGYTAEYKISVHSAFRPPFLGADSQLADLKIKDGALAKICPASDASCTVPADNVFGFESGHLHYSTKIFTGANTLFVTPTLRDAGGGISLRGAPLPNAQESEVAVVSDPDDFMIITTSEHTLAATTYSITVSSTDRVELLGAPDDVRIHAGAAFRLQLPGSVGASTPDYRVSQLPDGLEFNAPTRVISGTPRLPAAARDPVDTDIVYSVRDAENPARVVEEEFRISVAPALAFASPPPPHLLFLRGQNIPENLPRATGGFPTVSYALSAGLPAGLSFTALSRAISGVPTAAHGDQATVFYFANDSERGATGTVFASIVVRVEDFSVDVDASGAADADDGAIITRYLQGVRGPNLLAGLSTILDAGDIGDDLLARKNANKFDVTGDGNSDATDAVLIARYLLGLPDAALFADVTVADTAATKTALDAVADSDWDVDSSGGVSANDAILIARFLLGAYGGALLDGLAENTALEFVEARVAGGADTLAWDVDGGGTVTVTDGTLITRYLQNLRGEALVAGLRADAATVEANMEALLQ